MTAAYLPCPRPGCDGFLIDVDGVLRFCSWCEYTQYVMEELGDA